MHRISSAHYTLSFTTHTQTCCVQLSGAPPAGSYLLEELQAVGVIIVGEVNDARLAVISVKGLSQPSQGQVPLHGPARDAGIPHVSPQLVVARCLHVEVGVVQPRVPQQPGDERRAPLRVLHQDPVQVGDVQQGVGQARQLCLLHGPAVGGCNDVDGGEGVRPRGWAGINIFCPHHLHNVPVRQAVFLGVQACSEITPGVTTII